MRFLACVAAVVLGSACGKARDPEFYTLTQFSAVTRLGLSQGFLYFVESSTLKRIPVGGGAVNSITTPMNVNDFAAAENAVYVAAGNGIFRVPASGTAVKISDDLARAITADTHGVSWQSCDRLTHATVDGVVLSSTALAPSACPPKQPPFTLDESAVYGQDTVGVWFASRAGGPVQRIDSLSCTRLRIAGGLLYCGSSSGLVAIDPHTKRRWQRLSGEVHDFDVNGAQLYVSLDDRLLTTSLAQGGVETPLGEKASISSLVTDDAQVYFVNTEDTRGLLLCTER